MMQTVGRRYVRYVNDWRGGRERSGKGRYKASLVDNERQCPCLLYRYIELNPARAGMVESPQAYVGQESLRPMVAGCTIRW